EGLLEAMDEGVAACVARDQGPLEAFVRGNRAWALVNLGRAEEAVAEAEDVLHGPYPKSTVAPSSMIALSRARVRLGLPEGGVLDQARSFPTSQRDLLRRVPIAIVDAEAQWLEGTRPEAAERLAAALADLQAVWSQVWNIGEVALWLAILGRP